MTTTKAVVVLSGGVDSTTALYAAQTSGRDILAVSFDYGQRHAAMELSAGKLIAHEASVPREVIQIPSWLMAGSALTSPTVPVPHGHYEAESMKLTVVPNRNMVLLAIAGSRAVGWGAEEVWYGAHQGDHAIYPDCRSGFIRAMRLAFQECNDPPLKLVAPFDEMDKAAIVRCGTGLRVPYEHTYSCYEGGGVHCGRCGTCVERREAFKLAGVEDPTEYASEEVAS